MLRAGIHMQEGTAFILRELESFPSPLHLPQRGTYSSPQPYGESCRVPPTSPECHYLKTEIYVTALVQKRHTF